MKGTERIINNYLNGKTDFSGIYLLGNKATILRELKKYVEKHPKSADKINYIVTNLDELLKSELKHDNFMKVLSFEAKYEDNAFGYLDFACELLSCSEEDGIEICRRRHITDKNIKTLMNKLITKFPNQAKEIAYIRYIYDEYKSKYNKKVKKQSIEEFYHKNYDGEDIRIKALLDVYNSGYCIEEYCSNSGDFIITLTRKIESLTDELKEEYLNEYNEVLQRDNSEFYKYIKFVILKLSEIDKDKFTMMDYHTYTKLSVADFIKLVNLLFENETITRDLVIKIKIANRKTHNISKRNELNCKTVIGGREITLEEKEMIFDYLEEYDYPICDYKIALRKYLDGEILNDKQLIKK